MNKLQKRLAVFLFILSLGLFLSMVKAVKVVIGKNEEIGKLSSKITDFTKKTQDLIIKDEDREKNLNRLKVNAEELSYELKEAKKKTDAFQAKYQAEKKGKDDLGVNLNKLKSILEEERKKGEALVVEIQKLREEKGLLLRDLNEIKFAKKTLETFVAEEQEKPVEEKPAVTLPVVTPSPSITNARIVRIYPQGFLGIELEKNPKDTINLGKIVKGDREMSVSNIHSHMLIVEIVEGEDLSGFNREDTIKYVK